MNRKRNTMGTKVCPVPYGMVRKLNAILDGPPKFLDSLRSRTNTRNPCSRIKMKNCSEELVWQHHVKCSVKITKHSVSERYHEIMRRRQLMSSKRISQLFVHVLRMSPTIAQVCKVLHLGNIKRAVRSCLEIHREHCHNMLQHLRADGAPGPQHYQCKQL